MFFRLLCAVLTTFAISTSFGFSASVDAREKKDNRRAVAVIIGNKNYQGKLPGVDFAHNDARAFRHYVINVLKYDPENIIDLRDATKSQIESTFGNERTHEGKLWRYIDPRGRSDIFVFYSGHGVPGLKDRKGYLLPVDADPNAPEVNGYPLDTLYSNLARLKAASVTVFLDACFSGDSPNGRLVQMTSGISVAARMPDLPTGNFSVVTASQGDQVASWDVDARHGLFTRHLLDGLYGAADGHEEGRADNKITLSEIEEYLGDKMTRAARRNFGRHQIAWVSGKGQTVLAPISGKMRRPSLMSLSSPAQKPSKKPDISVKTEPPKSVVTPLRSVNNQSRNNSRSSLGNWTLEIETGSGNSGCLAYTMQLNAVLTRRRLTVNTPKFSSFSGKLKNEWSEEIIGHFMQGHYFYRYKLELFRDNFWQGSWTVLGDQNEGIGCAGALSMRR